MPELQLEINNSLSILNNGQILLYPTDTVWGLGCDASDENAVAKIFKIKQRAESKSLIILVDSIEMLQKYVEIIPEKVQAILLKTERPTTVIYENPKNLAKNVIAADNTVAIRIVQEEFCNNLIQQFGKPIVSTSANISGMPTPSSYKEIDPSILDTADYIVNLHREKINEQSSQIIKIDEFGTIVYLRK
jgi:L-threonylcarbamoyladenylate synthase